VDGSLHKAMTSRKILSGNHSYMLGGVLMYSKKNVSRRTSFVCGPLCRPQPALLQHVLVIILRSSEKESRNSCSRQVVNKGTNQPLGQLNKLQLITYQTYATTTICPE